MNVDLQNLLARRADSIEPPSFDPLVAMARGERRIRRRNRLTAAGAALALAVTMGVTALVLDRGSDQTAPSDRPGRGLTWTPGTRPITYGQEQTLHLGDREIDTGLDFLSATVTDEGAALTTLDGGIWFTDGTTVERIGTTLGALAVEPDGVGWTPGGRPRDWVVSDTTGSLLAWLEYPQQRADRPELVVYDSGSRTLLSREPVAVAGRSFAVLLAIAERQVFLAVDSVFSPAPVSLLRYAVDSNVLERVDEVDVKAARRGVPRALVVGPSADAAKLLHWGQQRSLADTAETLTVRESQIDELFDPHTGEKVELRVPAGYELGKLWFVQWLDDERFTLIYGAPAPTGDLLVCGITEGRCDVAIDASTWNGARTREGLLPSNPPPLLPGEGGLGAEWALGRAKQAALAARGSG